MGIGSSFSSDENVELVVMVTQSCEYTKITELYIIKRVHVRICESCL